MRERDEACLTVSLVVPLVARGARSSLGCNATAPPKRGRCRYFGKWAGKTRNPAKAKVVTHCVTQVRERNSVWQWGHVTCCSPAKTARVGLVRICACASQKSHRLDARSASSGARGPSSKSRSLPSTWATVRANSRPHSSQVWTTTVVPQWRHSTLRTGATLAARRDERDQRGRRLAERFAHALAGEPRVATRREHALYGPGRDRTCDLGIKSPLLYRLSYRPKRSTV